MRRERRREEEEGGRERRVGGRGGRGGRGGKEGEEGEEGEEEERGRRRGGGVRGGGKERRETRGKEEREEKGDLLLTGSWQYTQGAEVRETAGTSCRPLSLPLSQLSQHLLNCSNVHPRSAPPDTVTVVARGCECQGLEITGVSDLHVSRKPQQLLQERKVVGMSSQMQCILL